jgi:hypothetical protein
MGSVWWKLPWCFIFLVKVPYFLFHYSHFMLVYRYRASYPEKSVGSLSSSGVVNCIIDYYQFDTSVSAAAGNACADNIRRIQSAFEKTIETQGEKGFQSSLSLFNCEADMSHNDFYYMIADSWSMMIQYSAKTQLCEAINLPETASDQEIMENFATVSTTYWGKDFCRGGFCKFLTRLFDFLLLSFLSLSFASS